MTDESSRATYRILDASANRALEGLRTMEEFARFGLNDGDLSGQLKSIRHAVTAAIERLPRELRLSARDTPGDVGTLIGEASEYHRATASDVVAAAASRTAQSLRVIEEYGKMIDPVMATEIERNRYRCYTAASQLELRMPAQRRRGRLTTSLLYVLTDAGPDESTFQETVTELYQGGADILQLRDHKVDDRTLIARAMLGTQIAAQVGGLFIVNDRADIALAAGADGVHVGQDELPVSVARRILGPHRLIGMSTHSLQQAREARTSGADYIGCGPVFSGRTKSFDAYVGTELLREVSRWSLGVDRYPAFAIGGIQASNLDQVIEAGFRRIAVTGAVRDAADPAAAARELKQRLAE